MKTDVAFVVPTYNAGPLLAEVIRQLKVSWKKQAGELPSPKIVIIDDGSTDSAFESIREARVRDDGVNEDDDTVIVLRHDRNRGKGAALRTGLLWAKTQGLSMIVTLDADAQHPGDEAVRLALHSTSVRGLLLAVRDLKGAGAPKPAQMSNRFSNWVLSAFSGVTLRDTQCGLRRYPVEETLALDSKEEGYAFEADIVLRAARTGLPIEHLDCAVYYPPEAERVSHFHSVRDPARIVRTVIMTTWTVAKKR